MKHWKIIVIVILLGVVVVQCYITPDESLNPIQDKIDSLEAIIKDKKSKIDSLKKKVEIKEIAQTYHEAKADSLQELLNSKKHSTKEENTNLKGQNKHLRTALKVCKEANLIQTKTITIQSDIIVTLEMKGIETVKLHKTENKNAKKKSFLAGLGVGGVVVLILVLL
ncbi:MAG: hypothetical protein ACPGTO_10290 [Polaribacter sp.]